MVREIRVLTFYKPGGVEEEGVRDFSPKVETSSGADPKESAPELAENVPVQETPLAPEIKEPVKLHLPPKKESKVIPAK